MVDIQELGTGLAPHVTFTEYRLTGGVVVEGPGTALAGSAWTGYRLRGCVGVEWPGEADGPVGLRLANRDNGVNGDNAISELLPRFVAATEESNATHASLSRGMPAKELSVICSQL